MPPESFFHLLLAFLVVSNPFLGPFFPAVPTFLPPALIFFPGVCRVLHPPPLSGLPLPPAPFCFPRPPTGRLLLALQTVISFFSSCPQSTYWKGGRSPQAEPRISPSPLLFSFFFDNLHGRLSFFSSSSLRGVGDPFRSFYVLISPLSPLFILGASPFFQVAESCPPAFFFPRRSSLLTPLRIYSVFFL